MKEQIMKNKSAPQSVLICLFVALAFAVCNSPARATTTSWMGGSGDWFTCASWSSGCPDSGKDALINNGGKPYINISGATANTLTLGLYTGYSGTVYVDGTTTADLNVSQGIYVGSQGTGTLNITNGGSVESIGENDIAALAASNGSVTVAGSGSIWRVGTATKLSSRLFVGGNENQDGGTALLSITNGGTVIVYNNNSDYSVTVRSSGTVTGNGTLTTPSEPTVFVKGTLAPSNGTLSIGTSPDTSNLNLQSSATILCTVTPQDAATTPQVSVSGQVYLGGRLSVTMTGDFSSAPTRYTLLFANSVNLMHLTFDSTSITYPIGHCWYPVITYDYTGGHVHVYVDRLYDCN